MIKGFKQFSEETSKSVVFTFGRFNPPTVGHEKLLTKVAAIAIGNDYRVFASQSSDPKKNPLNYKEKVMLMRKIFPKHGRNIVLDKKIKNAIDGMVYLYNAGYTKVTMVVGADRISDFKSLLNKYNGVKARHGFYDFPEGISIVSAGDRDPDADDVSGMSASKMRTAAMEGDFQSFANGLPKSFGDKLAVFNLLRKRMGLKEMTNFRKHIELKTSNIRERYVAEEVFSIGDKFLTLDGNIHTIVERCTNYIVGSDEKKYFLDKIVEVKQDKDIKDRKGTQPSKYFAKDADGDEMAKSTKQKRAAHFKKNAEKDDDNKSAYKPAPGDATAKTKPSQHTKKFKDMFGEKIEYYSMAELKKQLKKEYGSKASSLKIVKIKGGVSIQTPSGQELDRYNNVPKMGYTIVEDKNPVVDTEDNVEEGVNDPAIFKAVFLAGGPGSGKSFTVGQTGLNALGLKLVNSDPAFEKAIKKAGGAMEPEFIFSPKGQEIRKSAKALTSKQMDLYISGRLGLIIDGTGKDYDKIKRQAESLKAIGYDVAMIFVNTDLETAIKRDQERKRTLGPKQVEVMWQDVQKNIGKFQAFFKNEFVVVDNSIGSNWKKATTDAYKKMKKFAEQKPRSKVAQDWIKSQYAKSEGTMDPEMIKLFTKAMKEIPGSKNQKGIVKKLNVLRKKEKLEPIPIDEDIKKGLQKKADKTGIPYGILKKVFDRGVAAWKTGHRPGTTPEQWGYARVNSFATKSKGTWGGADKDLAAKVGG
jgi:shikimate kinase/phosphopantetheine adenylyltransferase